MRYMRKTPVEAIQWNGGNQKEVSIFISLTTKSRCTRDDGFGNLNIVYEDLRRGRKFKVVVPKFGWVVKEGKTFQFYKDATFRKTFEEVQENDYKGIDREGMSNTLKEALDGYDEFFKGFKGVFRVGPNKETLDAGVCITPDHIKIDEPPKGFKDVFREDLWASQSFDPKEPDYIYKEKAREKVKMRLFGGLKEMASNKEKEHSHGKTKGIESDTFESVLDEMRDLHAKKNADYGDAAHTNFLRYGPVASLSRLSEKMQRAEHIFLSGKCEVKDEPLTSTLIDMAITSAMLYMELKNKENG